MPVYNTGNYIAEAIESVLQQTFTDFEFIIIDDGSTDNSLEIIHLYAEKDSRIQVVVNQENLGITKSLNKGIELTRGRFIARMDADDICLPERLNLQYDYLVANPKCAILGTWANIIDESGNLISTWRMPTSDEFIKWNLLWQNTFIHTSVIIRKDVLSNCEPYHECYHYTEDYELWERMSQNCQMENLPLACVSHRLHSNSISEKSKSDQTKKSIDISYRAVKRLCGLEDTNREVIEYIRNQSKNSRKMNAGLELLWEAHKIIVRSTQNNQTKNMIKRDTANRMWRLIIKSGKYPSNSNWLKMLELSPRFVKRFIVSKMKSIRKLV